MENYNTDTVRNYSEEEAIRYYADLKKRLDSDNRFYVETPQYTPQAYTPTDAYLKNYLANYTREDLHKKADAIIKAQNLNNNDEFIDYMSTKNLGDYHHFRSQWSPVAIQAREQSSEKTIKVGGKVVYTHDLAFSIAETLEMQDSSRDPVTEYYDWIKIQRRTENDIYTNGTTPSEIDKRDLFIKHMNTRETELKRIISLYSEAAFNSFSALQPIAQEKLKFLTFKLSELRRLRDRMASTKSQADRPEEDKEPENSNEEVKKVGQRARHRSGFLNMGYADDGNTTTNDDIFNFMIDRRFKDLININLGLIYANRQMNPVARSEDEAQEKINNANTFQHRLHEVIRGLRNGMSKDELIRQASRDGYKLHEADIRKVYDHHLPGFEVAAYQQADRERRS